MKHKYDKAVVIGRFQPFHYGHEKMVREALAVADTVYILIGSAYAYPNTLNPLTAKQRQAMITRWSICKLDVGDAARIKFARTFRITSITRKNGNPVFVWQSMKLEMIELRSSGTKKTKILTGLKHSDGIIFRLNL
ncbi:bifunctional NMN adenylyltransferase/nudix hydrolase [Klebsiella phage CPRSB]|nr:bifunctional NMN adenylyltransferase/nudix hydrolase [Klebsiella phage CPRSB]